MSENNLGKVKEGTYPEGVFNLYNPLNSIDKFKEKFADETFKILLNPKDGEYAALITVNKGTVSIEGIENNDKKDLTEEKLGWNGMMKTTKALFEEIGDGKLSQNDIIKKVVARKIKMKNPKILVKLTEMAAFLESD
jgi:hypothetical protein